MSKPKEQWYVSRRPGYCISLPEGLVHEETQAGVTRTKKNVTFRAAAGKMVKTTNPEIQKFLESTPAFKRKIIMRVPTPEEIAEHKREQERAAQLAFYQDLVGKPGVTIDFRGMSDSDIREVADKVGAETAADGKKLSKDEVADNVETLIYGEVVSGKKEKKPKEEKTEKP